MKGEQFAAAVANLETAITDEAGRLRPVTRIEFEPIGRQVRWTVWQGSVRLHTLTGEARDVAGFLSATKMILEMRAEDLEQRHNGPPPFMMKPPAPPPPPPKKS